ncbi:hypothetical protein SAY86_010119 [Trapa natans]|uniref:Dof zinc finger protein n=1 Tax=Trapa natans TaxID=22666 RepID=A0AAN7L0S8_TRANT|nr:hypothetical protein SAY86_010119 [Trapa natans]
MQDPSSFLQPVNPPFPEQERLKCPRCESSNTKFCYYNNYNLSQPRHFCKSCRRYWTKGGALRNIPVGGGTRKTPKRPANTKRGSSDSEPKPGGGSAQAHTHRLVEPSEGPSQPAIANPTALSHLPAPYRILDLDMEPERPLPDLSGSFSSLLASNQQFHPISEGVDPIGIGSRTVQFSGFGKDLNTRMSLDCGPESGLKLPRNGGLVNGYLSLHNSSGNCNGYGGNGEEEEPSYWGTGNGWPDLAISTPRSRFDYSKAGK